MQNMQRGHLHEGSPLRFYGKVYWSAQLSILLQLCGVVLHHSHHQRHSLLQTLPKQPAELQISVCFLFLVAHLQISCLHSECSMVLSIHWPATRLPVLHDHQRYDSKIAYKIIKASKIQLLLTVESPLQQPATNVNKGGIRQTVGSILQTQIRDFVV